MSYAYLTGVISVRMFLEQSTVVGVLKFQ